MPVLSHTTTTTTTKTKHVKHKKHNKTTSGTANQTQSNNLKSPKISTLLLSTKTTEPKISNKKKKNTNFASTTLRNLGGCTTAHNVSVPEALTSRKSNKEKINKTNKIKSSNLEVQNEIFNGDNSRKSVMTCGNSVSDDVWCGPGIGLSAADECMMDVRRSIAGRVKIDAEKIRQRQRHSCSVRRTVNPEAFSFFESGVALVKTYTEEEIFGTKYYPHTRHTSPENYTEMMTLQRGLIRRNRSEMPDRFSAWRLDVDNMSYEELLELGDRIGYVNTGLKADEISCCLRRFKLSTLCDISPHLPILLDRKCSICQEEYKAEDEVGKLNCGHGYHIQCIKQWLAQKNACPVCKTAPVAR